MDFNTDTISIQSFFTDKKYRIPRYQREYSWTKEQLEDFYSDIVSNIQKVNGNYKTQEYFFGTVILVGEMMKHNQYIEIIDGQQRITTITIFLSVLSNILYEYDSKLSGLIWKYIIAEDVNGELYNVMENESAFPYFQKKIQMRNIKIANPTSNNPYPITNSEEIKEMENELSIEARLIKEAYDFFKLKLEDENLSATIFKDSNLNKVEKLKLVRDQLLGSTFIYIISESIDDVNIIFENINSKGLQLSSLDLIKNEIFSVQNSTVPLDEAKQIWIDIKDNLRNDGEYISIQKFYRYFWLSRYTHSTEKDLYKKFKNNIKSTKYMSFLMELKDVSKTYSQIINPKVEYFRVSSRGNNVGKDDLEYFVDSLITLQNTLNIKQVQVLLITLVDKYKKGALSFKNMKLMIRFLEEFHFIYNGILTERTNTLENKYGSASRKIYCSQNQNEIMNEFFKLKKDFISFLPKDNKKFIDKFIQINYSSKVNNMNENERKKNMLAKYVIYKFEEILSETKNINFNRVTATIEHIIPESSVASNVLVLNIGNIIILEGNLNKECENKPLEEKYRFYEKSRYCTVKDFLDKYIEPNNFIIKERAEEIAKQMYKTITENWN
ncbi:DUF262 domain-containing protein [Fusobacterium nucleatum]|nr:DUF262 domain-containing protein [Fusobacterium nucleatum]WDF24436.1 DUF262 domain-containing protein [Fusobacterium nucleatum]